MHSSTFKRNFLFLYVSISAIGFIILTMSITIKKSYVSDKKNENNAFSFAPPIVHFKGMYACNNSLDQHFPTSSPSGTTGYYWGSSVIDGVVLRLSWSGLETGLGMSHLGVYNWTVLDSECKNAIRNGQFITLDIFGGKYAPSWLFTSPYTSGTDYKTFYISEAVGTTYCTKIPLPWSSLYISTWDTFIAKVGNHLSVTDFSFGGHSHPLMEAIKILKIGSCCTAFTSELRVPNDSCKNSDEGGCCPFNDSTTWVGLTKYTVTRLTSAIDRMVDAAASSFPGVIIAIPVIAGRRGFPPPSDCSSHATYSDCITPGIFTHLIATESDTNLVMGIYESLNISSNDGSICKMLTGVTDTPGIITSDHCLFGYQLNATAFGGPLSGTTIDCGNLLSALSNGNSPNGTTQGATYFEVFEVDFKTGACESNISSFHGGL